MESCFRNVLQSPNLCNVTITLTPFSSATVKNKQMRLSDTSWNSHFSYFCKRNKYIFNLIPLCFVGNIVWITAMNETTSAGYSNRESKAGNQWDYVLLCLGDMFVLFQAVDASKTWELVVFLELSWYTKNSIVERGGLQYPRHENYFLVGKEVLSISSSNNERLFCSRSPKSLYNTNSWKFAF